MLGKGKTIQNISFLIIFAFFWGTKFSHLFYHLHLIMLF